LPMTTLYTIGYEGTDIDRFIATLKAVGVHLLADVRALPLSRKKGFSKTSLRARIELEGMEYIHLSALGDPREGREAARAGQFDRFRRIYGNHLAQAAPQELLRQLAALVNERATCLMCFERDPTECHRLIVASKLPKTVRIIHLYGDEPGRYVRNSEKLPSRSANQGASAA
jgi:uncharacterized protein (DUF488 family)